MQELSQGSFWSQGTPMALAIFVEKTPLPMLNCFAPLSQVNWSHCGAVSAFSVPFHWSSCLSTHSTTVLIIVAVRHKTKQSDWTQLFFLQDYIIAILVLVTSHVYFTIIWSIRTKRPENLRNCVKIVYQFEENLHRYYVESFDHEHVSTVT